jgi:hypothetical protein
MSDLKVLSVKISQQYYDNFKAIARKLGMEQREFFHKLIELYEAGGQEQENIILLKKQISDMATEIARLNALIDAAPAESPVQQQQILDLQEEISSLKIQVDQARAENGSLADNSIMLTEKEHRFLTSICGEDIKAFILYEWIIKFMQMNGRNVKITFDISEIEAYNEFIQE